MVFGSTPSVSGMMFSGWLKDTTAYCELTFIKTTQQSVLVITNIPVDDKSLFLDQIALSYDYGTSLCNDAGFGMDYCPCTCHRGKKNRFLRKA